MEDTSTLYKQKIKAKYEIEKNGEYANFLFDPTPAKIRDLTINILRETTNKNDLKIFQDFMGFDFDSNKIKKIKEEIDKFRPLVNFLNGKTKSTDDSTADMLAVILDFTPRPYWNFTKKDSSETENIITLDSEDIDKQIDENSNKDTSNLKIISATEPTTKYDNQKKNKRKKNVFLLGISTGILALCTSVFYNVKDLKGKKCMIWNIDHYKAVDCNDKKQGFIYNTIISSDENLLYNFRKITVDSNTSFFDAKNRPIIWYGKNSNKAMEYFTSPGIHPETGKTLKPITKYMINKYVK